MCLSSLRLMQTATSELPRGIRYNATLKVWEPFVTPEYPVVVDSKPTAHEALAGLLAHLEREEGHIANGQPTELPDLTILTTVNAEVVKDAGLDFTPTCGWGWVVHCVKPADSACMGFEETPEDALRELIRFLDVIREVLIK